MSEEPEILTGAEIIEKYNGQSSNIKTFICLEEMIDIEIEKALKSHSNQE